MLKRTDGWISCLYLSESVIPYNCLYLLGRYFCCEILLIFFIPQTYLIAKNVSTVEICTIIGNYKCSNCSSPTPTPLLLRASKYPPHLNPQIKFTNINTVYSCFRLSTQKKLYNRRIKQLYDTPPDLITGLRLFVCQIESFKLGKKQS